MRRDNTRIYIDKELKNSKYRAISHLGELCPWGGFFDRNLIEINEMLRKVIKHICLYNKEEKYK